MFRLETCHVSKVWFVRLICRGVDMLRSVLILLLSLSSSLAWGQAPDPVVEWEKTQGAEERLQPFGDTMFGDAIDPHTGALTFTQTDIAIPGNSGLPVALVRERAQDRLSAVNTDIEFGDWSYVVPRLKAKTVTPNTWSGNRCSNSFGTSFPNVVAPNNQQVVRV